MIDHLNASIRPTIGLRLDIVLTFRLIELEGKKIGVKQGDIHFQVLKDMAENFNISCRFLETDEYETVFEMVDAHFVDVAVVNRLFGNRNKSDYRIKATPVIFNPIEMRYAVPEGKNEKILGTIDNVPALYTPGIPVTLPSMPHLR